MDANLKILFGLMGGLAMFLYGMNAMSDSLQKVAGERMKRILGFLTKNPIMGAFAGALVTAVLQSSSATTVMTIGFVAARLISLPQAISVIFGANIGTTMTAQLVAFKLSNYIYPIIFIGFLVNFAAKKERIKNIGMVIFSFGLLFEGIEIMGHVMKPIAKSPVFLDMMAQVIDNPILGVGLGAIMTIVVQSSSATIAVLQNFAAQAGPDGSSSIIGLAGAIPILLGDNIGTTITALLATIGQSRTAKRTALAHSVFNISGTIVCLFLIPVLAEFVRMISPTGPETQIIGRQIANAHTVFNIACTLLWLPLIPVMVKIVRWLVRGEDEEEPVPEQTTQFLDDNILGQPVAAIFMISQEVERMGGFVTEQIHSLREDVNGNTLLAKIYPLHYREIHDIHEKIASYIAQLLSQGNLTKHQSEQAVALLFVANNINRVSERLYDLFDNYQMVMRRGKSFSPEAIEDLDKNISLCQGLFDKVLEAVVSADKETAMNVIKDQTAVRKSKSDASLAHIKRMEQSLCDGALSVEYNAILFCIDRITGSCISVAEEVQSNKYLTRAVSPEEDEA